MKVIKRTGTANTTAYQGRPIEWLAVHYTAGTSCKAGAAESCAAWFANPNAGGSADYIVDERDLVQYNPDPRNRYCHAVGGGRYNTKGGRLYGIAKNSNCISLEICSGNRTGKITYPNDPNYYFTTQVLVMAKQAVEFLMDLYGIDAEHVIRHYDVNGKPCPGIIGWNTDSGSNEQWDAFHESIGGAPIAWYRVRIAWNKPETQIGAFTDLDNAKACADAHPGFSVYDDKGNAVYKAPDTPVDGYTPEQWISLLVPDAMAVGANNGILASILIAQGSLETGWGKTDLAKRHNIFGMKAELINSTWDEWSTWDHSMWYEKYSPEEEGGKIVQRKSKFRVYNSYKQCMEDYCAFLLHVRNNKGLKYARIKGVKDPAEAINIIYLGTGTEQHPEGYATDSGYRQKVLNLIKKYNLTQYDAILPPPQPEPEPVPGKKMYRVQVEADRTQEAENKTMNRIFERLGLSCFSEKSGGWIRVYCGSFKDVKNAEERRDKIIDAFKKDNLYQGTFIKEVEV